MRAERTAFGPVSMKREFITKIISSRQLYGLVRIGLALLFVYGGGVKLMDPKAFARVIDAYGFVPESLLPVVAVGLPLLEVLAGTALLFDRREGLAVIAVLLVSFVAILGYGVLTDMDVDCGCFSQEDLTTRHGLRLALYRDIFLAGGIIPYLYLSRWMRQRETANEKNRMDMTLRKEI
jgi:uncharacterized membrane protein YphA (DoxX/SURF4 family)